MPCPLRQTWQQHQCLCSCRALKELRLTSVPLRLKTWERWRRRTFCGSSIPIGIINTCLKRRPCSGTGHMKTISSVWRDARRLFSSASRDRVFCYGLIILACTLLPRIYCFYSNSNWIPSFNTAYYQMDTYGSSGLLLLFRVLRWLCCSLAISNRFHHKCDQTTSQCLAKNTLN